MALSFEEGLKNLEALTHWYEAEAGDLSEADTRFRLIDRLLLECLGWDRADIHVEERLDSTYSDYSLFCPQRVLVIEAKRESKAFELPLGESRLKYSIRFFERTNSATFEAIKQAMDYCQARGAPFGAISNGHQIVCFIAARTDGVPPLDGQALVFNSLDTLRTNFLLVWQCLSRASIASQRIAYELNDVEVAQPPAKLSSAIPGYPGFRRRNSLQTDLQILSELFVEDLANLAGVDEAEAIKATYCRSGALSQYATVSREILTARYSALFQEHSNLPDLAPATTKKGTNPELLAQSISRHPILLIGDRGVGKTAFIKNLFLVEARDVFEQAIVLYVDFGSRPALVQDLSAFIYQELARQLFEDHGVDIEEEGFIGAILHGHLDRFDRGIYGGLKETSYSDYIVKRNAFIEERIKDKDEFLKLSLEHITKGRRQQIVIFLDNVDQRPDDFQEQVFLIGNAIATNWPVVTFISIRPDTFYKSRVSGTLSAYHARAFTISPPRVDEVVKRRLRFGIDALREGHLGVVEGSVKLETLQSYLEVIDMSLSRNEALMEFLDNMCGGNVRLALDFLRVFLGSGHVDTDKILRIYRETGRYYIALHEFIRAVIYGDQAHYSPHTSEVLNILDISRADGREHFLGPIVLAYLERAAQASSNEGFVPLGTLYTVGQGLGFDYRQIDWHLERLLVKNLIESSSKMRDYRAAGSSDNYRITTVGAYYVRRLLGMFVYLDAVIDDLPIVDTEVRGQVTPVYDLEDRLSRAYIVKSYLDSQWDAGFRDKAMTFDWNLISAELQADLETVHQRAFS